MHGKKNLDLRDLATSPGGSRLGLLEQRRAEAGGPAPTDTLSLPPAPSNSVKMNVLHGMPPLRDVSVLYKHQLNLLTDP